MNTIQWAFCTAIVLCWNVATSHAQTLRGTVNEAPGTLPLAGATVVLESGVRKVRPQQTVSDSSGHFRFDKLTPGYYTLRANLLGYQPFLLKEILVSAGKERILEVQMEPGGAVAVQTVEIVEARPSRTVQPIGEIPLSREQTLRYPMTYFDPARLATAFAGVAQTDDGINGMSVRGNNPTGVRWRIAGADVVNPNHLPNAGTLNDRPNVSSGGVLMLSAQMLDNSALLTGAYSAEYDDGIGGVMDLHLRRGNDQEHEFTVQAGLIGLDVAAEGPLSKRRGGASYLLNYRYSTVGILGQLGVSFGGEQINFQDFAAHVFVPTRHLGKFSLFHLQGRSENIFTPPDSAKIYKDLFTIDYYSRSSVTGFTQRVHLGEQTFWTNHFVLSQQRNTRNQYSILYDSLFAEFSQREWRLSTGTELSWTANSRTQVSVGGKIGFNTLFSDNRTGPEAADLFEVENGTSTLQVWALTNYRFAEGAGKLHLGVHPFIAINSTASDAALDPRFQLSYRLHPRHQLTVAAGAYSQVQPMWIRQTIGRSGLMRSSIVSARHTWQLGRDWVWRTEVFRQGIARIAVNDEQPDAFALINETEYQPEFKLRARGLARNYGLETTVEHYLTRGWFVNANFTLLRSEYRGSDRVWRRSRWDVGHVANLTAGREWTRKSGKKGGKKGKSAVVRVFGANGRAMVLGGYRALPVDVGQSEAQQTTVYLRTEGYTEKQPVYYRLDGRVYWRRSVGERRNTTFALEFQNLTFRENLAYRYYDPLTKKVENKYQLGLIPNLSWRLEF